MTDAPEPQPIHRVPWRIKVFYGSGAVADGVKNTAFNMFLLFYYTNLLGLPGTLSGAAIFIALCFDAVSDPLVGSFSDHFRSRLGRRHPFMYAAALPMSLSFWLLFHPPGELGETGLFAWMTGFSIAVRLFLTFHMIPSGALGPEITDDHDERTSLVSWRYLFGWLGGLGFAQITYLVIFPASSLEEGRLDPGMYGAIGATGAAMVGASILACAVGTHRLIPGLRTPADGEHFSLSGFARDLSSAIRNPLYRVLLVGIMFGAMAQGFSEVFGLYMNTYFWEFSDREIAMLVYVMVVGAAIGFAAARPLSERSEKRLAAIRLACFAVAWGGLPIFLRLLGWFPENHDPVLIWLIGFHTLLLVSTFVGFTILLSSMIFDTVDEHELRTGQRMEGVFTAAIAFTGKAVSGFGNLLGGVALDLIAFPKGAEMGEVPPEIVMRLGLAVGPGLMLFYIAAVWFISRYPMTRERHAEILEALTTQRGIGAPARRPAPLERTP
ncbi:MAG: MFS transporter [Myxococcota bacterium]